MKTLLAHMIARRSETSGEAGKTAPDCGSDVSEEFPAACLDHPDLPEKSRRRAMLKKMIGLHDL